MEVAAGEFALLGLGECITELFPLDLESDILKPFFEKKTRQMSRIKGSKSKICTSRPPQNGPGVRVSVTDSRFCTKVLLDFLCNA